ncbi:hypothetical protein JCM7686_3078 [Paracoccus aminophilus JCM 7686]|uniref:GSCFA domain-containing protein n=2 Tax=Paracoccus aminophilus TaxID=34003 RepID=S5XRS4_PARAH|nr:hypothetical protein JCM7686_3078 [Paracoccus aminophilus JCM 7686]
MNPDAHRPSQAVYSPAATFAAQGEIAFEWRGKLALSRQDQIAVAGGSFARQLGASLRAAGLGLLDAEPAPDGAPFAAAQDYGYGQFSARFGRIDSARLFAQVLDDAATGFVSPRYVWHQNGRYVDAFRPWIEPGGMVSVAEVLALRRHHLAAVKRLFRQADCLILTLGAGEYWLEPDTGRAFPLRPDELAGAVDPAQLLRQRPERAVVAADLALLRRQVTQLNPQLRMVLSVSPQRADEGRAGSAVLSAVRDFAAAHPEIDYFPAAEIADHHRLARWQGFAAPETGTSDAVISAFLRGYGLDNLAPQHRIGQAEGPGALGRGGAGG